MIVAVLVSSFGFALWCWFFDVGALVVGGPPPDVGDDALSESGITLFVSNAAVLFDPLCDSFLGWKDIDGGDTTVPEVDVVKSALTALREELCARAETTPANIPADVILGPQVLPVLVEQQGGSNN